MIQVLDPDRTRGDECWFLCDLSSTRSVKRCKVTWLQRLFIFKFKYRREATASDDVVELLISSMISDHGRAVRRFEVQFEVKPPVKVLFIEAERTKTQSSDNWLAIIISKTDFLVSSWMLFCIVGSKDGAKYKNLANWSCAIGYGLGSGSPLSPSFNFGLELAKSLQFIASFYQHVVVQRRVKNPLEENEVVGITNYIDFGFELQTRVDDDKPSNVTPDSTFKVAASWQANKNFLLKLSHSSHGGNLLSLSAFQVFLVYEHEIFFSYDPVNQVCILPNNVALPPENTNTKLTAAIFDRANKVEVQLVKPKHLGS
ncbi:hypothetical protein ACSBR1_010754 [Camellia fascicularis]